MSTPFNTAHLDRMAWTIANNGFDTIPSSALRELGFEARQAGVHQTMTDALVDTATPTVVRQRIFGHIAERLAGRLTRRHAAEAEVAAAHAPCAA